MPASGRACRSPHRDTVRLLLSFLVLSPLVLGTSDVFGARSAKGEELQVPISLPVSGGSDSASSPVEQGASHEFTLRHIFHRGTYQDPHLHKRLDVSSITQASTSSNVESPAEPSTYYARSQNHVIHRLIDRRPAAVEPLVAARRQGLSTSLLAPTAWSLEETAGPNVTNKATVVSLARMTSDAYVLKPGTENWEDVKQGFNYSDSFGWESDGLRGHIFADKDNSTIVMALKGTSPAVFDGAETTTNDKINDNLFFSCCCAQGGQYFWKKVCDCYSTTYTCNQTCLVQAVRAENRYYRAALDLYSNVTELYPNSNVWLAGHSLGGSVSSLLGLTYGLPTTTFEAPAEALAASRIGLPSPPGSPPGLPQRRQYTGAHHFGHTADPIFMGICNGATAACSLGGYAMETQCHTGTRCVYDVVEDKGWRVGVGTHSIQSVIHQVIMAYDEVPECKPDVECVDCFNWKYFESNGSDPITSTTSSSTSKTRTRTSTCKTPGWFGCLDKTTTSPTTSTTTTTTTSSTSTSTCKTPGWFGGCLDPTSTTTSEASAPVSVSTSTAIVTSRLISPSSDSGTSKTSPATSLSFSTTTQSCTSREWFGLICVDPSPTTTQSNTEKPTATDPAKGGTHCRHRSWFGFCKERETDMVVS